MISNKQLAELEEANAQRTQGEYRLKGTAGNVLNGENKIILVAPYYTSLPDIMFLTLAANSVPALIARLKSAEDALKFYADEDNWGPSRDGTKYQAYDRIYDDRSKTDALVGGEKARAHFKSISQKAEGE